MEKKEEDGDAFNLRREGGFLLTLFHKRRGEKGSTEELVSRRSEGYPPGEKMAGFYEEDRIKKKRGRG